MMKLLLNKWLFFYLLLLLFGSCLSASKEDLQKKYEIILQAIDEDNELHIKWLLGDPLDAKKIYQYSICRSVSLLSYALAQNRLKIACILIALGYPLELYDAQRWTPLHWAAVHNYHEIFGILKGRGANIFALDDDRLTPYDHACTLNNHEIIALYTKEEIVVIEVMKQKDLIKSFICNDDGHLQFNGWVPNS